MTETNDRGYGYTCSKWLVVTACGVRSVWTRQTPALHSCWREEYIRHKVFSLCVVHVFLLCLVPRRETKWTSAEQNGKQKISSAGLLFNSEYSFVVIGYEMVLNICKYTSYEIVLFRAPCRQRCVGFLWWKNVTIVDERKPIQLSNGSRSDTQFKKTHPFRFKQATFEHVRKIICVSCVTQYSPKTGSRHGSSSKFGWTGCVSLEIGLFYIGGVVITLPIQKCWACVS